MKKFTLLLIAAILLTPLRMQAQGEPAWWEDSSHHWFTANLSNPNDLALLLSNQLADEQTLANVEYLRVSGSISALGADDIALIKNTLTGLKEVDMYDLDLTILPNNLFDNVNPTGKKHIALQRVRLPRNLVNTGIYTFEYCKNLVEVVVPATLSVIGKYAFYRCESLPAFDFSITPLTSIDYYGFAYTAITSAELPSTLNTIGGYAFAGCGQLSTLTFPSYVASIGTYAFYECISLTSVTVPVMGTMHTGIFDGCTGLTSVILSEGLVDVYDNTFYGCTNLTSVTLPSSIRRITSSAFKGCTQLAEINLNEGLREIGTEAFYNTAITSITLPSTLVNLYSNPFSSCNNLTTLTCKAYVPPIVNSSLFGSNDTKKRTLVVAAPSLAAYKAQAGWNQFDAYSAMSDDQFPTVINAVRETTLISPSNQPSGWKPDMNLLAAADAVTIMGQSTAYYSPFYYDFGSIRLIGSNPMALSSLNMTYDDYRRRNNYNTSAAHSLYAQLLPESAVTADRVEIDWTFYTSSAGYWHFISFPFDVDLADHDFDRPGHYLALYKYDGRRRADGLNGWVRLADTDRLSANKGYILSYYAYDLDKNSSIYDSSLKFHSDTSASSPFEVPVDDVTYDLDLFESEYAHNSGWNFIGNPYTSYFDSRFIDFSSPITVRTANGTGTSSYRAYSLVDDSYVLAPGEAFFVQASPTASQITFDKAGRQTVREARTLEPSAAPAHIGARNAGRILVNLSLTGGDLTDHTRIVLNPEASARYESSCDAAKFFAEDATMPQICSQTDGVQYAINELPDPEANIVLYTRIPADGRYAIALDTPVEDCSIELIDTKRGLTYMLGSEPYDFDAETSDSPNRFAIRINAGKTGVNAPGIATDGANDLWFNLQGIRIERPTSGGIYIRNGKKVIVK